MHKLAALTLMTALVLPMGAQRGGNRGGAPQGETATNPTPPKMEDKSSKTEHTISVNGQTLKYTAVAGTLVLRKEDSTPTASIFYTAYTKDDVTDLSKRPITFAFNGGPGSSSIWLHLGSLGPKRVMLDPEGQPLPPPYRFADNPYTLLDQTDLVFIDPVSTGYSRAAVESDAKNFHGLTGDVNSVGEFIRLYTTRNGRWDSPKFLAGESYGTTRAAALSGHLQESLGINLNGIVLMSAVLNFGTIRADRGNDLPYVLYLPTFTAAAWYHKKLPKELESGGLLKAIEESRRYAAGPYTLALFKGDSISAEERTATVKGLARLTGVSPQFIEQCNLRVSPGRFEKELLRDQRRTLGRYDSRLQGVDEDAASDRPDYDPSYASVQGAFTAAWNQYVHTELKYESDLPYEVLTDRVYPWSYREYENRYVDVAGTLRDAMTQNAALRVFVANGYYDLATPFLATEYTINHMLLDPKLRDHVSLGYYEAGHMMYTQLKSLEKLKQDISKFMTAGATATSAAAAARRE
jgi:carboxypeptidase C (cathepsin A)